MNETSHELNESSPKQPKLQEPSVIKYGKSTDSKMKAQLDELVSHAFYVCNIPFNVISHPEMQKTFTQSFLSSAKKLAQP